MSLKFTWFFIGVWMPVSACFVRTKHPMPDPTEMILTGGFAAALGIFGIFAVSRWLFGRQPPPAVVGDFPLLDETSPYQPARQFGLPPAMPVGRVCVWFYRPLDLVGACLVYAVFAAMVLGNARGGSQDAVPALTAGTLLINMGFQFVMAGAVAIGVVRRVGWIAWLGLRWPGWPWIFLIAPAAVVFIWVLVGGLQCSGFVEWMESFGVETVQDTVKLLRQSEDPMILALMSLAAVVSAPLCEEIVFRGYFYPILKRFAGAWPAAVCASLVFALAHGNLAALLPLFIFGGVLVFVYEKTGSLWAPIAVHFCFNSATVVAQLAVRFYPIQLPGSP